MEHEFQQPTQCSAEEEVELFRSVKNFKDNSIEKPFVPPRKQVSYRDSLIGDIPGAYAQALVLIKWKIMLKNLMMKLMI